jgi:hypothetical protein
MLIFWNVSDLGLLDQGYSISEVHSNIPKSEKL